MDEGVGVGLAIVLAVASCGGGSEASSADAAGSADAGVTGSGAGGAGGLTADGGGGGGGSASPDGAATADAAAAGPTWSRVYATLFTAQAYPSNCLGAGCHDPGRQKGIDLATAEAGYRSLRAQIVPGAPDDSKLIAVLRSGKMPEGKPHMPPADLDLVRAWIAAGALDD